MNRKKTIAELIKRDGDICKYCGKQLSNDEIIIDHILPVRCGGNSEIDNLAVSCRSCNMKKGANTEFGFKKLIKDILTTDERFNNIESDVYRNNMLCDITFTKKVNSKDEVFIVEVKWMFGATSQNIDIVIKQLQYYQEKNPSAHLILALPTTLAQEYRTKITEAGFILWDRDTLSAGIPEATIETPSATNIYDELIIRLHKCQKGAKEWQTYQNLVGDIIGVLFHPPLEYPIEQPCDEQNLNRRDFLLPNYATDGLWYYMRTQYHADYVVVEAKNSADSVSKDDLLQVAHYLGKKLLVCLELYSHAMVETRRRKHILERCG